MTRPSACICDVFHVGTMASADPYLLVAELPHKDLNMRHYCTIETAMGHVALLGEEDVLLRSTLPHPTREDALNAVRAGLEAGAVEDEAGFGDLPGKLRRYFDGETVDFSTVPIDQSAYGPFHAKVIAAAQQIPYGTLVTYQELARTAGSERAARAAGSAMASNNTPIIVPCHRVVAAGGKIGGFGLGLGWKRDLLKIEGVEI